MIKKLKDIMGKKEKIEQHDEETLVTNEQEEGNEPKGKDKKKSKGISKEEQLQLEIENLNTQVGELKDKFLRLFAEFDNYKKRTIKEKMSMMGTAAQDTMSALLPILDDFDRAKYNEDTFSEGVMLVYNKLYSTLQQRGLQPMESTGETFDPELHEAITEIPAPSDDMKGKVMDTVEKGYFLNNKIIRHAKVVVGK